MRSAMQRTLPGVVALVSAVPGLSALLVLVGVPSTAQDWLTIATPIGLLFAVLLTRRSPVGAMALLAVVTAFGFGPVGAVMLRAPALVSSTTVVAAFLGVGWVTAMLGASRTLSVSVPVVLGWAVLTCLGQGSIDVALLVVGLGWWAVGQIVRSHQQVAARLRTRAAELAAEQERYATEAVRLERATIARELHDVVAHCMTVIVIQAQAGRELLARDPAAAGEAVDAILGSVREASDDVAALAQLVDVERNRPLTPALLDELVDRTAATGATVELTVDGDLDDLEPDLAVSAHRAVREALTNALRHAPGASITVAVQCRPFALRVANGPPRRQAPMTRLGVGRGLEGLAERIGRFGLRTEAGPTPDGGWQLVLEPQADLCAGSRSTTSEIRHPSVFD